MVVIFPHFSVIEQEALALKYWTVEQRCRRFTKTMGAFIILEHISFVIALLFSIYSVYTGNFDTSKYYLPLRIAAPFNTGTVARWYAFLFMQLCLLLSYALSVIPVISYFVCCCFYLDAMCDHFNHLISMIDGEFEAKPNDPNDRATAVYCKGSLYARKLLKNAIDHHNKIYE